jgi:hypothetical protein
MSVVAQPIEALEHSSELWDGGVYLTDGQRLFRLISPQLGLYPSAELEDCITLSVDRYYCDELYAMRLHRVRAAG